MNKHHPARAGRDRLAGARRRRIRATAERGRGAAARSWSSSRVARRCSSRSSNIIEQTKGSLLQTNPQLSKDLNDVATQLRTEFMPKRDELILEAAKRYAQRFSEAELKELVVFFKTPTGRKMQAQEPLVLDDTFNFVRQWGPRVAEDVMNRYRAEMKKKGHNL